MTTVKRPFGTFNFDVQARDANDLAGTRAYTVSVEGTTMTLTVSPNPSAFGQSVTFTATVTSTLGTPTGVVTFTEGAALA